MPLQGAIVVCDGWGEGDDQLWGSGRGGIESAMVGGLTANFGGMDVVPLQGAIVVCYGWGGGWRPALEEWTWCHCWVPL